MDDKIVIRDNDGDVGDRNRSGVDEKRRAGIQRKSRICGRGKQQCRERAGSELRFVGNSHPKDECVMHGKPCGEENSFGKKVKTKN